MGQLWKPQVPENLSQLQAASRKDNRQAYSFVRIAFTWQAVAMEAAQKALHKNGLVAVQPEQPVPQCKAKRKDAAGSGASSSREAPSSAAGSSAMPEGASSSSAGGAPAKRARTKQAPVPSLDVVVPVEPVHMGEAAPGAHNLANDVAEQDPVAGALNEPAEPMSKKERAAQKRKRDAMFALEFLEAANLPGLVLPDKQHFSKCSFTLTPPADREDATSIGCVLYSRAFFVKKPTSPRTWTPGARIYLGKAGSGVEHACLCGQEPGDNVSKGVTICWHGEPSESWKVAQIVAGWVPPTRFEIDEDAACLNYFFEPVPPCRTARARWKWQHGKF